MIIIAVMGVLGLETIIDSSFVDSLVCPLSLPYRLPRPLLALSVLPLFPLLPPFFSLCRSSALSSFLIRSFTPPTGSQLPLFFPFFSPITHQ